MVINLESFCLKFYFYVIYTLTTVSRTTTILSLLNRTDFMGLDCSISMTGRFCKSSQMSTANKLVVIVELLNGKFT